MRSELEQLRIEIATERGFIAEGEEREVFIQLGLENLHTAPIETLGQYAINKSDQTIEF